MNRRQLLAGLCVLAGIGPAAAHTPYGQWVVYRKKHLLIGSHRSDPLTYDLAKRLVGVLAERLPKAKSRVARAPNAGRLASLIGTDQLDVAVLSPDDAKAMHHGTGRFAPYGAVAIRQLASIEPRLLVAHERFPDRHAWLVVAALHAGSAVDTAGQTYAHVPWHPGSASYLKGEPEPS